MSYSRLKHQGQNIFLFMRNCHEVLDLEKLRTIPPRSDDSNSWQLDFIKP